MPAPRTAQQAFNLFLEKVSDITERLGGMGVFVGDLARSFRSLAELSHRLAFQMGAMVGMPRFIRGDVRHLLADGHERGHPAPPASSTGAAQTGGGYKSFDERVAELRKFHAEKEKLAQESRTNEEAHWVDIKRQRKDETEADAKALNDKKRREDLLWISRQDQAARQKKEEKEVFDADVARLQAAKSKTPSVALSATGPHSAYDPANHPAFYKRSEAARKIARDRFGMHEAQLPNPNPHSAAYRDWVDEIHRQVSPHFAQPGFPTALHSNTHSSFPVPLSGGTIIPTSSAAATAAPRSIAGRFRAGLAESFRKNSFVAGFLPQIAPYFNAIAQAAQAVTRGFLGVTSVTQGLLQAAAPDLWATFTTSLEMLAAQVGGTLIPFFMELALDVQEAARVFGVLSPEMKANIGAVLKWTLIVTGAAAAIAVLATVVSLLLTPVGLVAAAFVALAAVTERYLDTQKKKEHKSFQDLEDTTDMQEVRRRAQGERLRQDELNGRGRSSFEPLSDKEVMEEAVRTRNGKLYLAQEEHKKVKDLQEDLGKVGYNIDQNPANKIRNEIKARENQAGIFETSAANIGEWLAAKKNGNKVPDYSAEGKANFGKLLLALPTFRGAAGYSSIEDAYKKTQVAAMADDPATAQLKRIQAEFLKQLVDNSNTTKTSIDNIGTVLNRLVGF